MQILKLIKLCDNIGKFKKLWASPNTAHSLTYSLFFIPTKRVWVTILLLIVRIKCNSSKRYKLKIPQTHDSPKMNRRSGNARRYAWFLVRIGHGSRRIALKNPGRTTVGRRRDSTIRVKSPYCSRSHCCIVVEGETVRIIDENVCAPHRIIKHEQTCTNNILWTDCFRVFHF